MVEIACAIVEEPPHDPQEPPHDPQEAISVQPPPTVEAPLSVSSKISSPWWTRTPLMGTLLRVFSSSWGLPEPQTGLLRGANLGHGSASLSPSASLSTPFTFTADPEALERARRNQRLAAMLFGQGSDQSTSPTHTVLQVL